MRNTSEIRKIKETKKQAERKAQALLLKQNRSQKKAAETLKEARVAVATVKRKESSAERLAKLQNLASRAKRQAMYIKPGFVTLTKKEIAELSAEDRILYMAQKTKEDRKNDSKSEVVKARHAAPRKRTVRRELERAVTKAQRIVDKANPKPAEAKVAKEAQVIVSDAPKHSHKRETERRARQAAKKAAK